MANIADWATVIYVLVDDYLKSHPKLNTWRRSNNAAPAFTDSEVLAIGLLQSPLGVDKLKQTYRLVCENIRECFPKLPSYGQWLARLHQLDALSVHLLAAVAQWGLAPGAVPVFVADSKPVPVCKPIRHGRGRLLRDEGAYFGKNSCGWFFGCKLHVVVHQPTGLLLNVMLTSGEVSDRFGLNLCADLPGGSSDEAILLADEGFSGEDVFDALLEEYGLLRVMPSDTAPADTLISQLRQRVETSFSQCWRAFIDRVFSRSWRGLWNTIKLKLICYNLFCLGLISR